MVQQLWNQWRLSVAGIVLVLLIAATSVVAASDLLRVGRPDQQYPGAGSPDRPIVVPSLLPGSKDDSNYTLLTMDTIPQHPDAREVAYLAKTPAGTESVEAKFYPQMTATQGEVAFFYVGIVRYQINGHTVYLVTAEPSAKAAEHTLILGDGQVGLAADRPAYTGKVANRRTNDRSTRREFSTVSFSENGLIVSLSGDLPQDQLIDLARSITLSK